MPDRQPDDVLTLAEAASYLRVPEEDLLRLTEQRDVPAQRIGAEWMFLKRALADWLRLGPELHREFRRFPPPWVFDHPFWEDFFRMLADRLLAQLQPPEQHAPRRGSKEAALKHFGVFKGDADLDKQLADLRSQREAGE